MNEALDSTAAPADSSTTTDTAPQPTGGASPESSGNAAPVVADPNASANAPASNGDATGQPAVNWEEKAKATEKSYNELRRKLELQGREKNEYRKEFETLKGSMKQLAESIAPLIHKETYDPAQFQEELLAKGPAYIVEKVKAMRDELLAETNGRVETLASQLTEVLMEKSIDRRRADSENYPDFKKMEVDMAKIYNANAALFDAQYPDREDKIDALYNAARLQRGPDALKQAEALGRKKTEEELAREAHASGAGGGKAGAVTVPDPSRMSAAQLREHFVSQGMVSDS